MERMSNFFRKMERLEASLMSSTYKRTAPRGLNDNDFDGFDVAVAARRRPRNVDQIEAVLKAKNPVRWRRIHSDYRWMQREFRKLGLNPDDAKELL